MSKSCLLLIFFFSACFSAEQKQPAVVQLAQAIVAKDTCPGMEALNNKVRDGLIRQDSALKILQSSIPQIKSWFYANGGKDIADTGWVFPIEGYTSKAIGGENGSGYQASGYNYFDGNKHGGHPAHDIFIHDANQDCLDDKTRKPVNVLSMTGGIVLATESKWDSVSDLRGGKYIWIYEPGSNSFFYYGHNNSIAVKACDIVTPGQVIATVGRTGLNAFKKRSPTHLHFMQLKLDDKLFPKPTNCYNTLLKAKKQI